MTIDTAIAAIGVLTTIFKKNGDKATLSAIAKVERRIKAIERQVNRYAKTGRGYRPETGDRLLEEQFETIQLLQKKISGSIFSRSSAEEE